jgi:hypothetical protein
MPIKPTGGRSKKRTTKKAATRNHTLFGPKGAMARSMAKQNRLAAAQKAFIGALKVSPRISAKELKAIKAAGSSLSPAQLRKILKNKKR